MKNLLSVLLASAIYSAAASLAFAQVAPVCAQVAADPDGDGFGWENDGSCIITMESEPAPVFVNRETNEYVNLIRAYWNPPTDLYGKTIVCFNNIYRRNDGRYVPDNDPGRETRYTFHYTHFPLTATAPFTGTVKSEHFVTAGPISDFYYEESFTTWSMDNGIYTGGAPFTESPYVEIVTVPSTNETAIRTWRSESSFVQCSTVPTGVPPVFGSTSESETAVEDTQDQAQEDQVQEEPLPEETIVEETGIEETVIENQTTDSSNETIVNQNSGDTESAQSSTGSDVDSATATTQATTSDEALVSDDETISTSQLSNPFATTANGGGGSIGIWLILLLAGFTQRRTGTPPKI